jgi:glycosyltransferase involved in cell wall biosynthesis
MIERMKRDGWPPKVAMVCIGIGRSQRGYERYFSDIFALLGDDLDITLFKSGGATGPAERIPRRLEEMTRLARLMPLTGTANSAEYRRYRQDCLGYWAALLPEVLRGGYDVVHVIDYPLAEAMQYLRRLPGFSARVIYTNGCCVPPGLCPQVDRIHYVSEPFHASALAAGLPGRRTVVVPCGIYAERFASPMSREELRRKHGVAQGTYVVLAVTAVKRQHKRVDHIVDEVSSVPGNVLLWIDGKPEDAGLVEAAKRRLRERLRISCVPSESVGELYRLADVFVHAAVEESFGLSIVEAMSCALPVLVHDTRHFEWLTGGGEGLVDMTKKGQLAGRLSALVAGTRASGGARGGASESWRRFEWSNLKAAYLDMYADAAGVNGRHRPVTAGLKYQWLR